MKIDVREFPVIDNHCHPYWPGREDRPLFKWWNSSLFYIDDRHLKAGMTYFMVNNMLRYYMGMPESATRDEVLAERNRRYKEDPKGWGRSLIKDANLKGMLIDISYPISAWLTGIYMQDDERKWFEDLAKDIGIGRIIRFEFVYNKLLPKNLSFDDFVSAFCKRVDEEVKLYDTVSFKSVIGYFTGLEIENVKKEDAVKAYDKYQKDRKDEASEKKLRDYMLWRGAELCIKHNLPLQIHTGMGNTPMCKISRMNPALLHDFLCVEEHQKIKTMILHAGYPHMRIASYVAAHFPQVSLDVSQMVPHAGRSAETGLFELLEVAPFTKIHYASDGGALPEHTWYSANYFKDVLSDVLTNFCVKGVFSRNEAYEIASRILTGNTKEFYNLDWA
jgi:hypothetical protein